MIKVVPINEELYEAPDAVPFITQALLFGGDRWLGITHGAIATDGGFVIGLATIRTLSTHAEIEGVWVRRDARRQGLGFALYQALIEFYAEQYPNNKIRSEAVTASGW